MFKRFGPPALVTLLVVATAIAFAVTEHLKLKPVPITSTRVTKQFSPICRCDTSKARIAFSLRRSERITLLIVGPNRGETRRLIDSEDEPSGLLHVVWDGRDNSGQLAPNGNYHVSVNLANERLWIPLPNVIQLDTQPPKLSSISVSPHTISPDGDHNRDALHISYRLNERARILLFVDGKLAETTRNRAARPGRFDWKGVLEGSLLTGWHNLTLRAVDLVGNESAATAAPIPVRVRILNLRPKVIHVAAGATFRLTVSTDRTSVRWLLNGQIGPVTGSSLLLQAPSTPGRYRAVVRSGPYRASTLVIVR